MQVADALGVSHDLFQGLAPAATQGANPSTPIPTTMQALLELRLLRVFRELQDHNAKRMLIQLAEQIVKRQAARPDERRSSRNARATSCSAHGRDASAPLMNAANRCL